MEDKGKPIFAMIKPSYFTDHFYLQEVLKKNSRLYLGLILEVNDNKCFIPLRSQINIQPKLRKAGFHLPTENRPYAGLDYRKLLIINDESYVEVQKKVKIPNVQKEKIYNSIDLICLAVNRYINTYIKETLRERSEGHIHYKYSTLKNFHSELNLPAISK